MTHVDFWPICTDCTSWWVGEITDEIASLPPCLVYSGKRLCRVCCRGRLFSCREDSVICPSVDSRYHRPRTLSLGFTNPTVQHPERVPGKQSKCHLKKRSQRRWPSVGLDHIERPPLRRDPSSDPLSSPRSHRSRGARATPPRTLPRSLLGLRLLAPSLLRPNSPSSTPRLPTGPFPLDWAVRRRHLLLALKSLKDLKFKCTHTIWNMADSILSVETE